jgi:GH43 family beta-xylosidase
MPLRSLAVPLLAAAFAACSGGGGGSTGLKPEPQPPVTSCTFSNPLMVGADPSIVRQGGVYYSVQSRDGGIVVYRSASLTQLDRGGVKVWTMPDTGWNRANVWAPELQFIGGKWYIYYAAGRTPGGPFISQRTGVLESVTDDPQGQWVDRGRLDTGGNLDDPTDDVWAIDLTTLVLNGQRYAIWSGWEQNAPTDQTQQNLYIAPMSSPTRISGARSVLSTPDQPWEDNPNRFDLQEGPTVLEREGRVFVVYSTRESWLPDYRYGMLTLTNPAAPTTRSSWSKSNGPVFQRSGDVFGPGHGTFTTSPDGSQWWMVYHAKTTTNGGWDDRVIRAQPFSWRPDGTPDFGTPVPNAPIARPAGECTTG